MVEALADIGRVCYSAPKNENFKGTARLYHDKKKVFSVLDKLKRHTKRPSLLTGVCTLDCLRILRVYFVLLAASKTTQLFQCHVWSNSLGIFSVSNRIAFLHFQTLHHSSNLAQSHLRRNFHLAFDSPFFGTSRKKQIFHYRHLHSHDKDRR